MPELTDYERGARDMRAAASAWLDGAAKTALATGLVDVAETLRAVAKGARHIHLPRTPPASPETESKDAK